MYHYKQRFLKKDYPWTGYKLDFIDGFLIGLILCLIVWTISQNLADSKLYFQP